jgi:hypothetical protein
MDQSRRGEFATVGALAPQSTKLGYETITVSTVRVTFSMLMFLVGPLLLGSSNWHLHLHDVGIPALGEQFY